MKRSSTTTSWSASSRPSGSFTVTETPDCAGCKENGTREIVSLLLAGDLFRLGLAALARLPAPGAVAGDAGQLLGRDVNVDRVRVRQDVVFLGRAPGELALAAGRVAARLAVDVVAIVVEAFAPPSPGGSADSAGLPSPRNDRARTNPCSPDRLRRRSVRQIMSVGNGPVPRTALNAASCCANDLVPLKNRNGFSTCQIRSAA